jgi:hypothetical protein
MNKIYLKNKVMASNMKLGEAMKTTTGVSYQLEIF